MMLQSAKMVSVGGLAAGVAHEINNPLGAMMHSAQMLQLTLAPSRPRTHQRLEASGVDVEGLNRYLQERGLTKYLESIREAGGRAAKIVSLKKKYDFRDIEIVHELATDLPQVVCDGQQIQQVVLNLVRNAAQAMANADRSDWPELRPRLTLCTSFDSDSVWVWLEVEDNGPGIPEAVRERLFEPFFNTKDVGEGTGLGLWLCWSIIVERHRGQIWVESVQEGGTRFVVELPLALGGTYVN